MCPTMDGLQSDSVLSCGTALHAHHVAGDLDAVRSASFLGDHLRRYPALCSGVSTVVRDDAQLLLAVTDPESARWTSATASVWDQSGLRPESRSFGKLGTERMEWQMKGTTWDFNAFQGGSEASRRTHENDQHQWAAPDDALYSGFGTTQKSHHLRTSSSSGTTGSLDSASSTGFPVSAGNCSNGLLLAPCTIQDTGKIRDDWLFADNKDEKASYQLSCANGGTAVEHAAPKASIAFNESGYSGAVDGKRNSLDEPADLHQVGICRGGGPSASKVSSSRPAKKHRIVAPGVPRCQVEGCKRDLTDAKDYHRRHKVCEEHAKAPKIIADGIEQRFCQQCSRFHPLGEFDDAKKSCRKRLAGHNERRRKSCQDTPSLAVASVLQDGGRHLDRSYFMQHPLAMPLAVYQNGNTTRAWSRAFELKEQVATACRGAHRLNGERQSVSPSYAGADRQLMFLHALNGPTTGPSLKYTQGFSFGEGLTMTVPSSSQGPNLFAGLREATAPSVTTSPGTHPGLLDSGRALSLLSSQALLSTPNRAVLEKLELENGTRSLQHQQYPVHYSVAQSNFPGLTDIPQKLRNLPSSPRSLGLSICTSASVSEDHLQDNKPLITNLNAVHNLGTNPLLAQQLQRPQLRSLGGSSSNHAAKPTLDLMKLPPSKSQQNHGQYFATSHEMLSTAQISQHLQSLRDYGTSSVFNAHPKLI